MRTFLSCFTNGLVLRIKKMAAIEKRITRSAERKRKSCADDTGIEDAVESEHLTMSAKRSKSEKKKRRSSFVRGRTSRRSLPAANASCAELHTKVPNDEPAEKRLYILKQACFKYAMQRLKDEAPGLEGFEEFEKAATDAFQTTLDKLETDGMLRKTCSRKNSTIPNPINLEIEKTAQQIQSQMDRLKTESDKWEEVLQYHTEQAEQEESNSQKPSDTQPITRIPGSLSQQQRKLLTDLPDLGKVQMWAKDSVVKLQLQVDKIHKTSEQLKQLQTHADEYLKDEISNLAKASFCGSIDDPKQMLNYTKL